MIDKVKGVVIEPNGIAHSFGKCRMVLNTTADEAHGPSFKREILSKDWFKNYGYDYKQDETLFSQIPEMTKYGFSFVINHSSVNPRGTNYYCYSIQIAKESIPNIKNYFKNIYPIIKDVQDVPEPCYVEGMIYENGCEALEDIMYDVDEFYDQLVKIKNRRSNEDVGRWIISNPCFEIWLYYCFRNEPDIDLAGIKPLTESQRSQEMKHLGHAIVAGGL